MTQQMWLPPSVVRDVRAVRAAEIEFAVRTDVCERFTVELRRIDPYLELVWWPEYASAPGFVPGRYHVVRHNPDAAGSVEPLVGRDGEYREPDSSLFELVRRSDLWNGEVQRERRRLREEAVAACERAELREREEIAAELQERVAAVTRTQVSLNRDTPWAQNSAGLRRGAARAA